MTQADQSLAEFEATLKANAPKLIESLQQGRFDEATQMFNELSQARNHSLYQEVGKLTRELHNAIVKLEMDTCATGGDPSPITDATDRLSYVVEMTEKAANRTMDLVEESTPLLGEMSQAAQGLRNDWGRFMRREMSAEEFRDLARRVEQFLGQSQHNADQLSAKMNDILLAQDYQDLTGQVIKKVTALVADVENSLLKLVLMASHVDRFAGIHHDREQLRSEQAQQKEPSRGEGPQIHADKREDVVSGQDDVDDLLSSLGF